MTGKLKKLKYLKAKKAQIFARVQRLFSDAHTLDPTKFLISFQKVEEWKKEYSTLVDEINEFEDETEDYDLSSVDELENLCIELEVIAKGIQAATTEESMSPSKTSSTKKVRRLPDVPLPLFSGESKTWTFFREAFEDAIHNNEELSDTEKINYLLGCLRGSALAACQGIPPVASNYKIVWQTLNEKFDDPRGIANSHMAQLLNFKPLNFENVASLNTFLENFDTTVQAIKKVGISDLADFIFSYLAFSKLPVETQKSLEASQRGSSFISYDTIVDFVKSQRKICAHAHDRINIEKSKINQIHFTKEKISKNYFVQNRDHLNCLLCEQMNHVLFKCPKFLELNPKQRYELIRREKRCLNCLSPHFIRKCKSTQTCRICHQRHHTLLHFEETTQSPPILGPGVTKNYDSQEMPKNGTVSLISCQDSQLFERTSGRNIVLLSTISALVYDLFGVPHKCRFLLDSGSQSNFLTLEFCRRLQLKYHTCQIEVLGIGSRETEVKGCTQFLMSSHFNGENKIRVNSLVIKRVIDRLPSEKIAKQNLSHLKNVCLADPEFDIPAKVDGILGAEIFSKILKEKRIVGPPNRPIGLETDLGYVIMGSAPVWSNSHNIRRSHAQCAVTDSSLELLLKKFWEIDDVPESDKSDLKRESCEERFLASYARTDQGRYIVKLPFESSPNLLGDSFGNALHKFLRLEKKFIADPLYCENYSNIIKDYIDQNHLSETNDEQKPEFYIPHHGIFKKDSVSTPMRVVFDASCKTTTNYSLNDILSTGPKLQKDLSSILLRFRTWKIAFTSDIKQMYRQIWMHPEHRRFQKIVWRFAPNEPLKTFCLNTVTFGVKSSPYLALRVLQQLARDEKSEFPKAAQCIEENMYIDDLVAGADSVSEACLLYSQLMNLFQKGGFTLCKWASHDPDFRKFIPLEKSYPGIKNFQKDEFKVLGIIWKPSIDNFYVETKLGSNICTKRNVLSTVARCYDPLGFLSPVTLFGRLIIKNLWELKLDWDENPPDEIRNRWNMFYQELPLLSTIQIPRFLGTTSDTEDNSLIGFCDACTTSYGAMIYLRTVNPRNEINVKLIYAKAKVAPSKPLTIPKLELCAAHLLAKIIHFILESYKNRVPIHNVFSLSDSTIVLSWLGKSSKGVETFVANRVSQISSLVPENSWSYISSKQNPADMLSRSATPAKLRNNSNWFDGPAWLKTNPKSWPIKDLSQINLDKAVIEPRIVVPVAISKTNCMMEFIERQSNYRKMVNSMKFILKFCKILPAEKFSTTHAWNIAEQYLVRIVQTHYFRTELNSLQNKNCPPQLAHLRPFVENSLIRVGGRLELSNLAFDNRHPLLLPKKSHFNNMLIDYVHQTNLHTGPQLTFSLLRQKFWILNGRSVVRFRLKKCNFCFRFRPTNSPPLMGNLPLARIQQAKPFLRTGVDYAGPFPIVPYRKRGVRSVKAYLCVFVCMSVKAVHLELVTDLSSQKFLQTFKRFLARRGTVTDIFSDNGTNFIGAKGQLDQFYRTLSSSEFKQYISSELTTLGVNWHLIPPRTPHMGGLWESQVKVIKNHLFKGIGSQLLTYEEMTTVLCQIEALLNSRPLCVLSSDPQDPTALTPSHFLTLGPLPSLNILENEGVNLSQVSRFRLLDQLVNHFWKRWHLEYLHTLQPRKKWQKDNPSLRIGSVVIFEVPNVPPLTWPLGIVTEVHPGKDKIVRVVTIKTKSGEVKRPARKVYPLPSQ